MHVEFKRRAGSAAFPIITLIAILIAATTCICAAQEPVPDAPPAIPPTTTPGPARVASGVIQGLAMSQPAPSYPSDAKKQHVEGFVVMHAIISKTGTIEDLKVISGPELLRKSAIDAVTRWKYKPYLPNGEPVEVQTTINVNFKFNTSAPASMEGLTGSPVAPPPQDARVKVPASTMASLLISKVDPVIPADVHTAGTVILHVLISKLGSIENVEIISGDLIAAKAISDAVKLWKYKPFELNGSPVEVLTTISIGYSASGSAADTTPITTDKAAPSRPAEATSDTPTAAPQSDLTDQQLFDQAGQASKNGDDQQAIDLYRTLLARHPGWQDPAHPPPSATQTILRQAMFRVLSLQVGVDYFTATGIRLRKIGGGVSSPVVTHQVFPRYSPEASRARYNGIVLVTLVVDEHGMPQFVHILRGMGMGLDENAVEAVKQYRFKPAMEGDKPVPVELNIEINFQTKD